MEDRGDNQQTKTERRQRKKAKRRFKLHGSSLRTLYLDVIRRRLKETK